MSKFYSLLVALLLVCGWVDHVVAQENSCVDQLASGRNQFHVKINKTALRNALKGLSLHRKQVSSQKVLLADYSINSRLKRGYLIDFERCEVLAHEYVAHGGTIYSPKMVKFSDLNDDGILDKCKHKNGSKRYMTRPGFLVTAGCHVSQKNFPFITNQCRGVKLRGLEARNSDVYASGVVLHEHELMPDDSSQKPEGQGCPIFAPGKLKDMLKFDIWQRVLVYLYTPQCE